MSRLASYDRLLTGSTTEKWHGLVAWYYFFKEKYKVLLITACNTFSGILFPKLSRFPSFDGSLTGGMR